MKVTISVPKRVWELLVRTVRARGIDIEGLKPSQVLKVAMYDYITYFNTGLRVTPIIIKMLNEGMSFDEILRAVKEIAEAMGLRMEDVVEDSKG